MRHLGYSSKEHESGTVQCQGPVDPGSLSMDKSAAALDAGPMAVLRHDLAD